ncbi:MAG TPA: signal peptidase I [Planctomycetes bacterium]|nr:signal peptidase I [Planctomycetota bacterium]HIK59681.1 signal peptidase I [Planctomycetota bacterium]
MDSAHHDSLVPNQLVTPAPQAGVHGTVLPSGNAESLASLMRHAGNVPLAGDLQDYRPGRILRPMASSATPSRRRWRSVGLRLVVGLFFLWGLAFNVSEVRGSSMEPGIHDRDHVMVDHVTFRLVGLECGDIVVLQYPLDPSLDYIKRVIGLPGDKVVISRGRVFVNGAILDEPYVGPHSVEPWTHLETVVRADHCFVLGDNRNRSSDSREFGQVPYGNVRGKAMFRFWPVGRIGTLD